MARHFGGWLRRQTIGASPRRLWFASGVAFVLCLAWIMLDPYFESAAGNLRFQSGFLREAGDSPANSSLGLVRKVALPTTIAVSLLLQATMFVGLIWGSRQQRALRSWFVFLTFTGLWITAAQNWQDLSWWGKQQRLKAQINGFELVARELHACWPEEDGQLASQDSFMAYPVGNPTVLIMLTLPDMPHTRTSFGAVERGASGALRFQLAGPEQNAALEHNDWLEWHPGEERPGDFIGGVMDAYLLDRSVALGDGWHLARYRSPGTAPHLSRAQNNFFSSSLVTCQGGTRHLSSGANLASNRSSGPK